MFHVEHCCTIQIKSEVVLWLLIRHNEVVNLTQIQRDARYLAEAKKILDMGEHIAMHIIMGYLKELGWEPDMETEDGWVRRK